ncbi:MAG: pyridoxal-phosphate dependent enzyme, partial [Thiomicrorhabdus sp.]|nr:pyridoxal-phosphate dependent enzyme [Thiomicrorhabdus sp.]
PLTQLISPLFEAHQVNVYIKRDELNHPLIQGNKWHKLRLNVQEALRQHKTTLLTFGGAYSNHIAATAVAAQEAGLDSIGVIRGDELARQPEKWSHTLQQASKNGMVLQFVTRAEYRKKSEMVTPLQARFPDAYILPEGGSNALAVEGFKPLMQQIERQCPDWTHLFSAVGTGATLAGLIKYAPLKNKTSPHLRIILGVPAMKQGDYLHPKIHEWIEETPTNQWQRLTEYHCGGYAKTPAYLLNQKQQFEEEFGIQLDPVYTAKMVYAFYQELKQNKIPPGSTVILLHTGGLQGNNKLDKDNPSRN